MRWKENNNFKFNSVNCGYFDLQILNKMNYLRDSSESPIDMSVDQINDDL